jgi:hypothetical protein
MRSNLAAFLTAVAAGSLGLLAADTGDALNDSRSANEQTRQQLRATDDLVTQLCDRGADPDLCAEAGRAPTGIRYVMTGRSAMVRWPQFAEPR